MSTALVVVDNSAQKHKITEYLQKNANFSLQFPANVRQAMEIVQNSAPNLIVICLLDHSHAAEKLCEAFRQIKLINHVPILLIQNQLPDRSTQIADAQLNENFAEQEFTQIIRQFTMGY
ncbi:MAG: hypothetical protein WBB82_00365 [Limnothrix sp.]